MLALAIAALIGTLFWSILNAAATQPSGNASADLGYLIYITTLQATLSTVLSLLVGTGLAWALNRLRSPRPRAGHRAVSPRPSSPRASSSPSACCRSGAAPAGWALRACPSSGSARVVAAHLILDGAFAARILLARLDAIPEARLKTGQSLALTPWTRFAVIDWPALRGTLPGLAAIIFLLAFTSFPIVLLLGGGPSVQTLEIAIYSAVRLDFDLGLAVQLALIQIAVCAVIILASSALAPISSSLDRPAEPRWRDAGAARVLQWAVLAIALLGFAAPTPRHLDRRPCRLGDVLGQRNFWAAAATSLGVAVASSLLALLLALTLAASRAATASRVAPHPARRPRLRLSRGASGDAGARRLPAGAPDGPAARSRGAAGRHHRQRAAVAALRHGPRWRRPSRPSPARGESSSVRSASAVRGSSSPSNGRSSPRDVGLVLALSFCFSLGDLGVIALFGTQDFTTLPLLMVRALGAYRAHDAGAIAALMLVLTIVAFVALPKLVGRLADARA